MVGMYCANHATCPFYKFWREDTGNDERVSFERNKEQLEPIAVKTIGKEVVYVCIARNYCESSADQAEKFLDSISSPAVTLDNNTFCHPIPRECSVLATLTDLNEIKGMLEARKE